MLLNKAISGTITIPKSDNSYILNFDQTVYNLLFDHDYGLGVLIVKINEGDHIKIYDMPARFENVEVYKIEFIKQNDYYPSEDIDVYYQGFVK